MSLDATLQRLWYGPAWRTVWLWPLSALFALIVFLRRALYRSGLFESVRVNKPVIVVGNLTVGGTGKTPLVIWLANRLQAQGRRVGIITRGYGGRATHWPQRVQSDSDPYQVGDEAVLLASQTQAIVCAGPDRVADAKLAIAAGAEVILSDDGLQHYQLARDAELVVVDASRGLGNGCYLPAGPLREGRTRLAEADAVLLNCRNGAQATRLSLPAEIPVLRYRIVMTGLHAVNGDAQRSLHALRGQVVHAVTGIGHPEAFIEGLRAAGLHPQSHILPDHAQFTAADIQFNDALPVLMTGKDAVKSRNFADARHEWVTAEVQLEGEDERRLLDVVQMCLINAERKH